MANGRSANGSSHAHSSSVTAGGSPSPPPPSSNGSVDSSDASPESPTSVPLLSHESADSSLVDPVLIQRKVLSAARQAKSALVDAEQATLHTNGVRGKTVVGPSGMVRGQSGSVSVEGSEEWKWGRAMSDDWVSAALAFGMMSVVPFIVLLMLHSCQHHQCSIQAALTEAVTQGQQHTPHHHCPHSLTLLDESSVRLSFCPLTSHRSMSGWTAVSPPVAQSIPACVVADVASLSPLWSVGV